MQIPITIFKGRYLSQMTFWAARILEYTRTNYMYVIKHFDMLIGSQSTVFNLIYQFVKKPWTSKKRLSTTITESVVTTMLCFSFPFLLHVFALVCNQFLTFINLLIYTIRFLLTIISFPAFFLTSKSILWQTSISRTEIGASRKLYRLTKW